VPTRKRRTTKDPWKLLAFKEHTGASRRACRRLGSFVDISAVASLTVGDLAFAADGHQRIEACFDQAARLTGSLARPFLRLPLLGDTDINFQNEWGTVDVQNGEVKGVN